MPKSQKDTRGKVGLPGRLCGDDVVHQREEPLWIVLDLDVNVELDVLVLGLWEGKLEPDLTRKQKAGRKNSPSSATPPSPQKWGWPVWAP